ncbi:MAG: methyltransferase domain-containing protein, partial [Candidatus Dadabacteria bacterium]
KILAVYDRTARDGARAPGGLAVEVGEELARRLGYAPEDLRHVPPPLREAFVGAANLADRVDGAGPVADLGCGAGLEAWILARRGHPVAALDASGAMLGRLAGCLRDAPRLPLRPVRGLLPRLPFRAGAFDWALLNGAANLVPERDELLREAARILRPGGRLLVADLVALEPLPEGLRDLPEAWAWCVAGAENPEAWAERLARAGFDPPEVEILERVPPLARAVVRARRR